MAIQKVLIPQYGAPYKLQSVTVTFDMPLGAAAVTKTSASTGAPLAGAVFELVSGNAVIATQTTGADGVARFENLQPGVYTIREKSAPEGYLSYPFRASRASPSRRAARPMRALPTRRSRARSAL